MNANVRLAVIILVFVALGYLLYTFLGQEPPDGVRPDDTVALPAPVEEAPAVEAPVGLEAPLAEPVSPEVAAEEVAAESAAQGRPARAGHEAAKGRGLIRGSVQTKTGSPVADAQVVIRKFDWNSPETAFDAGAEASMSSDAEGRFEFAGLELKPYAVVASRAGEAAFQFAYLQEERRTAEITLALSGSGSIEGAVVDPDGKPVAGARVMPKEMEGGNEQTNAIQGVALMTSTQEDGSFALANLSVGKWKLFVRAEGFASLTTDNYIATGSTGQVLTLGKGGSIAGRAVFADSQEPVPNLKLIVAGKDFFLDQYSAKTDAVGAFSLATLAAGDYTLRFDDPKCVMVGAPPEFTVTAGQETSGIVVKVAEGGVVTGRVYDTETKSGIHGANLRAYPQGGAGGPAAQAREGILSDSSGNYRIEGLGEAQYRIVRGQTPGYPDGNWNSSQSVSVAPGKRIEGVDIPVTRGLTISGTVVDKDGKPVSGAQVNGRGGDWNRQDSDQSAADGSFELAGFNVSDSVKVLAEKDRYTSSLAGPFSLVDGSVTGVEIRLEHEKNAALGGIVVDPQGRVVANATVNVQSENAPQFGQANDRTDNEGRFFIASLAAGAYNIYLSPPGSYSWGNRREQIELKDGEQRTDLRLVLDNLGSLEISGRVTDASGKGLARAHVYCNGQNGGTYQNVSSDDDGNYALKGLTEGAYWVSAQHQEYTQEQKSDIAAGSRNVNFVLQGRGAVEGQVVDARTNKPIAQFEAQVVQGQYEAAQVQGQMRQNLVSVYDEDGRFSFPSVEARDSTVIARAPGYALRAQFIGPVKAGETVSGVLIRLESGKVVEGLVVDGAGKPIAGASIYESALPQEWERSQATIAQSKQDGTFTLDSLQANTSVIYATHPSYSAGSGTIQGDRVTIVLSTGGIIEGHVTLGGEPIEGAYVSLGSAGRNVNESSTNTDAQGYYKVGGLIPGDTLVNAQYRRDGVTDENGNERYRRMSRPAIVAGDQTTVVDFDFEPLSASIYGRVTVQGKPAPSGVVNARVETAQGQEEFRARIGADGTYRIAEAAPGRAFMRVTVDGQSRDGEAPLALAPRQSVEFNMDFSTPGSLSGAVYGIDPQANNGLAIFTGDMRIPPPSELTGLEFAQLAQQMIQNVTVQADGTYTWPSAPAGQYTIVAYSVAGSDVEAFNNGRFAVGTVTITEGEAATLDFTVE